MNVQRTGSLDYARMLREGFTETCAVISEKTLTHLEYLSDYIFDFSTYDGEMSELFATKALEVCKALSNKETFEYIKDPEQYRWYLLMCNMPFFASRLEWGTSIRGAWWTNADSELSSSGLWIDNKQVLSLVFTEEEWRKFIAALLDFSVDNSGSIGSL